MVITLTGNPISTQHAYGQHGKIRYMKKDAKDLKEQYQWEAKSQWKKKLLTEEIAVCIKLFFKDHRRRDFDNWHKISIDALTGVVWDDDSQIKKATIEMHHDRERPRIEITIL